MFLNCGNFIKELVHSQFGEQELLQLFFSVFGAKKVCQKDVSEVLNQKNKHLHVCVL